MLNFIKNFFSRNYSIADPLFITTGGDASWESFSIENAVKRGLKGSSWVYIAIDKIKSNGASVDWLVYDENDEPVWEHHLTELFRRPNPNFSKKTFFEIILIWLELTGKAPVFKNMVGGKTTELWLMSPDRIQPIPSKNIDSVLEGYKVNKDGTFERDDAFDVNNIIYIRFPDPSNPIDGISPLEVSMRSVGLDNGLQNHQKSMSKGIMDGILTFGDISHNQLDVLRERVRETFNNNRRSGIPNILSGNPSYIKMGLTQSEMDTINTRKFNREEILSIFGVPPQILGLDGTIKYDNFLSGLRILWSASIFPILGNIAEFFDHSFKDELSDGQYIWYSIDHLHDLKTALRYDEHEQEKNRIERETKAAGRIKTYWDMGIPVATLNEMFDMGIEAYPNWDMPFNVATPQRASQQRKNQELRSVRSDDLESSVEKKMMLGFKEMLDLQFYDINQSLQEAEDIEFFDVEEVLKQREEQSKEYIENIFTFGVKEFAKQEILVEDKRGASVIIDTREGPDVESAIETAISVFLMEEMFVLEEVMFILASTASLIMAAVEKGVAEGISLNKVAESIQQNSAFSDERALRLARTLTTSCRNIAQIANADAMGATHKTWITAGDKVVRAEHYKRNGVSVPMKETFSKGVRFPGDPKASANDRINCRCGLKFFIAD